MSVNTSEQTGDSIRWKNVLSMGLLGTAIILGVAWFMMSVTPPSVDEDRLAFDLVDIYGERVSPDSEKFKGKVLLVDIWGLWCPPCIQQIPYLIDLQERYGRHGFEVIGVEFASYYGDDRAGYTDALRKWAKDRGINYTIVQGGETTDITNVFPTLRNFRGFPTSVLIDRNGRVHMASEGFAPSEVARFENTVKTLLAEKPAGADRRE